MIGKIIHICVYGAGMLALGACALPPAVQIASYTADAVSYAGSGKSLGDHAISAATGEDCALIRILGDRPVCGDEYAGKDPGSKSEALAQTAAAKLIPAESGAAAPADNAYTLLGIFRNPVSADIEAKEYRYLGATVTETRIDGETHYAVTTRQSRARAFAAGRTSALTVYLCEGRYYYRNACPPND